MNQYHNLVEHVLRNGKLKTGRNGDTLSVFGHQMRFDLTEGFPLVTTKAINTKAVINEFLWMVVKGSTDVKWLQGQGHTFWDAWQSSSGTIGEGYGHQFRRIVRPTLTADVNLPPTASAAANPTVFGVGELGDYDRNDPDLTRLQGIWRDMMRRCYHQPSTSYCSYGGRGVHVHGDWHVFSQFQKDARRLPNWELKQAFPDSYTLDKDYFGTNQYGPDTCRWSCREEQSANTSTNRPFTATSPKGVSHLFYSVGQANREQGLNLSAVHRCLSGDRGLHTHHGWSQFRYVPEVEGHRLRFRVEDQVTRVLAQLKVQPDSRRLIVSLWDSPSIEDMQLPPCHGVALQFHSEPLSRTERWAVAERKRMRPEDVPERGLSCQMYQRSGDLGLGVPWNIAFYSLMTEVFAKLTDHVALDFVHTLGDAHIYANHIEPLKMQMTRKPKPLPRLRFRHDVQYGSIDNFVYDDVIIDDYNPHPHVKMEVSA